MSPDVTIDQKSGQADPTNVSPVTFTVVFNEPINESSFVVGDIDTSSSTATGISVTAITEVAPNDDTTFEVTLAATGDGTIVATIPASSVVGSAIPSASTSLQLHLHNYIYIYIYIYVLHLHRNIYIYSKPQRGPTVAV